MFCFKAIKHQVYPINISLFSKEDFGSSKPNMDSSNCHSLSLVLSSLSDQNYSGSELVSSYWDSSTSLSSWTLSSSLSDQNYSGSELDSSYWDSSTSLSSLSYHNYNESSLSMRPVCNMIGITYSPSIDTDSCDCVSQYALLSSTNSPERSPHIHPTSSAYLRQFRYFVRSRKRGNEFKDDEDSQPKKRRKLTYSPPNVNQQPKTNLRMFSQKFKCFFPTGELKE